MLCWQWHTGNKCLVLAIKMMGVVMRYYLCPLAYKFWWEHWYQEPGYEGRLWAHMIVMLRYILSPFLLPPFPPSFFLPLPYTPLFPLSLPLSLAPLLSFPLFPLFLFPSLSLLLPSSSSLKQDACSGRTPLHYAVEAENFILVNFLLENGANVNAATFAGKQLKTPGTTPAQVNTNINMHVYKHYQIW